MSLLDTMRDILNDIEHVSTEGIVDDGVSVSMEDITNAPVEKPSSLVGTESLIDTSAIDKYNRVRDLISLRENTSLIEAIDRDFALESMAAVDVAIGNMKGRMTPYASAINKGILIDSIDAQDTKIPDETIALLQSFVSLSDTFDDHEGVNELTTLKENLNEIAAQLSNSMEKAETAKPTVLRKGWDEAVNIYESYYHPDAEEKKSNSWFGKPYADLLRVYMDNESYGDLRSLRDELPHNKFGDVENSVKNMSQDYLSLINKASYDVGKHEATTKSVELFLEEPKVSPESNSVISSIEESFERAKFLITMYRIMTSGVLQQFIKVLEHLSK